MEESKEKQEAKAPAPAQWVEKRWIKENESKLEKKIQVRFAYS